MNQQSLFSFRNMASPPARVKPETHKSTVSRMRNTGDVRRLVTVVRRLERATDALERARFAMQARDLADAIVASSIQIENDAGTPWRDIGNALDVPFPTLYRRYAGRR